MINILNCSGNITTCCTSSELIYILGIIKNIYSVIQIIVPILLIIGIVIRLIKLVNNPDEKSKLKPIFNSILATGIIFFLPTIINALLGLLPYQVNFSACWIAVNESSTKTSKATYIETSDVKKNKVGNNSSDYEKGKERVTTSTDSSSNSSSSNSSSSISSGTTTEAGSLTGVTYLNGGMAIPIYYQGDYSDVSLKPGTDRTVATSGCGFTSISMIVSYLLDKKITPRELVDTWSRKYYIYQQGMSHSGFQGAATHYGLGTVETTTSSSRMVEALKNNQPVASNQGAGLFTSGGHYIVLRGVTSDGKILVNDPNRKNAVTRGYNNRAFTVSEIQQSNKMYFIFPKKK